MRQRGTWQSLASTPGLRGAGNPTRIHRPVGQSAASIFTEWVTGT
jgi:hypothetical protein